MALLLHRKPKHNTFTLTITNPSLLRRLFSEFRRRTSPPAPPTDTPSFSFQDLHNHGNVSQKPDEPAGDPDLSTAKKPGGGKYSFYAIRERLNQISNSPPSDSASPSKAVMNREFVKIYGYDELGEKLKMLRPEGKVEEWFSIGELSERLMRLKEMEANEPQKSFKGLSFTELRESLNRIRDSEVRKERKIHRIEILGQLDGTLDGTPDYLLTPPKEHPVHASLKDVFKVSSVATGRAHPTLV